MPETWGDMTVLRAAAESVIDHTKLRVAAENRALRGGAAVDAVARDRITSVARTAEAEARQLLYAIYEVTVPGRVRRWAAEIPGLATGEVFPKLVGLIGNPRVAVPYRWETGNGTRVLVRDGDPYNRSLHQLWQWCGCGNPLSRPASGMTQEELLACGRRRVVRPVLYAYSGYIARAGRVITKETSKRRGQPVSQAVADSRYFRLFAEAKEYGLTRRHEHTCRNHKRPPMSPDGCGTVAHPEWGEPGSPWRPGHAEAHAHRMVAKELLRDLWVISG